MPVDSILLESSSVTDDRGVVWLTEVFVDAQGTVLATRTAPLES